MPTRAIEKGALYCCMALIDPMKIGILSEGGASVKRERLLDVISLVLRKVTFLGFAVIIPSHSNTLSIIFARKSQQFLNRHVARRRKIAFNSASNYFAGFLGSNSV